jgi:hypothetical protein
LQNVPDIHCALSGVDTSIEMFRQVGAGRIYLFFEIGEEFRRVSGGLRTPHLGVSFVIHSRN